MSDYFFSKNKAAVLSDLESKVKSASILPQVAFTQAQWADDAEGCAQAVLDRFGDMLPLIVRSSSTQEDLHDTSMAGAFDSVLNVLGKSALVEAIQTVCRSFGEGVDEDVIFIQPMLPNVSCSGVVFTYDPNTKGPYYVIEYFDGEDTAAITAGSSNSGQTYYIHRNHLEKGPAKVQGLIAACREIEQLTDCDCVDIEFAITDTDEVYIFQARPIVNLTPQLELHKQQEESLRHAAALFERAGSFHPYIKGNRTIFGCMPDWNPAEIIGFRPRALALSLYKEMVTDRIWAYQRDKYGYRNLRSVPLLYSMAGCPFIDVRASFNSFVPKGVSRGLTDKLVNYYLDRLEETPELHDKIEFEVIFSCYLPSTPRKLEKLRQYGFDDEDITALRQALKQLTNNITHSEIGNWRVDLGKIEELQRRQHIWDNQNMDYYSKMYWLGEDCKRYGTLPFAGLARAGFIATQYLSSLQEEGLISKERLQQFWNSLETIGYRLKRDLSRLDRDSFLARYGHLRPGTYDILSTRYDETPDAYFDWTQSQEDDHHRVEFDLLPAEEKNIQDVLDSHEISHTSRGLFRFIKAAIEGREYGKFVFTYSLSQMIQCVEKIGQEVGFSREDCSYLNIQNLLVNYAYGEPLKDVMARSIEEGKKKYAITQSIALPSLIVKPDDVWAFKAEDNVPNYITQNSVSATLFKVDGTVTHQNLQGKIALIANADPGFDWILGSGLVGFITCYGGPNSHMAVRAAELNVPAVIGTGERIFNRLHHGGKVIVDCANRLIKHI